LIDRLTYEWWEILEAVDFQGVVGNGVLVPEEEGHFDDAGSAGGH